MTDQEKELYVQRQNFLELNGLDMESEMIYQAEKMAMEEESE